MPSRAALARLLFASLFVCSVLTFAVFRSGLASRSAETGQTALVPIISATKTVTDVAGTIDGNADPGDTLEYTVTINNTGADPATNLSMSDTLAGPQTLVAGSLLLSPIAVNDTYAAIGNVGITVPDGASDLLGNDLNPGGGTLAIVAPVPTTSANGGNVTINTATGDFTYNPPAGFEGSDTFTYTLGNGSGLTNTATVTINVAGMIWFVDNSGANGDGRLGTPFNSLANFNAGAADGTGDNIFLYRLSASDYVGPITLLNNQKLIGQGATATLVAISGVTVPPFSNALPATGGTNPNITSATVGITLGQGNTIRGLNVGNVGTAAGNAKIFGNNFGTLTVGSTGGADVALTGTGQALNLTTGTFAATSQFSGVTTTSSSSQGITLAGIAGTVVFGSTTVSGNPTQCILVGTSTANINFGNTSCTGGTDGISLQNNSGGTRTFGTITTTNGSGDAFLHAVGGGTTTVTGATSITNPGGNCIDIQDSTTAISFQNVTCNDSAQVGVFLDDNTGAVSFVDLDINTDLNVAAFQATAGNTGTITTTSGTIADTGTATAVEIVGTSAASRTPLNMVLTSVSSNGGSANGIILTNTSGTGFSIVGTGSAGSGGTIANKTGADGSTTQGTGIFLNTVNNVSLARMQLNDFDNYAIRGLTVDGFTLNNSVVNAATGTNGTNVGIDEGSVIFGVRAGTTGLTGTASITNTTIEDGAEDNLGFYNASGALNLTIDNVSVNQAGNGAIITEQHTGGTINVAVNNSDFTNNFGPHFFGGANNAANLNVTFGSAGGNVMTNTLGDTIVGGTVGVQTGVAWSGSGSANISNNTITGAQDTPLNVNIGGTGTFNARVHNNTIGTSGVAESGTDDNEDAIRIVANGDKATDATPDGGTLTVAVTNNTIQQVSGRGILIFGRDGGTAGDPIQINATVTGNILRQSPNSGGQGIRVEAGASSMPIPDNVRMHADIGGTGTARNDFQDDWGTNLPAGIDFDEIRVVDGAGDNQVILTNLGADTSLSGVATYLAGRNILPAGGVASASGSAFSSGGTPPQPPIAPPAEEKEVAISLVRGSESNPNLIDAIHQSSLNRTDFTALASELVTGSSLTDRRADIDLVQVTKDAESEGWPFSVRFSTFVSEVADRFVESISPTVHAQDKKTPEAAAPETGETVSTSAFTLPAGETITVKFRATVDNGPYASGLNAITNTANITADGGINVNSTQSSINLDAAPDLVVTKTEGGGTTQPGVPVVYTLSYSNATANNGQHAANVVLTETVPANTTFNAANSTAGWSCPDLSPAATVCTFSVGAVNAGAAAVNVNFAVNVLGALPAGVIQVSNTSSIAENPNVNGTDLNAANNTGPDTTNIIGNWLGGTSTDWFTASNWSNNTVPPSGNNVSIPGGGNVPTLSGADATVNNLVLNGQNLFILAGRTVTVNGTIALGINSVDGAGTLVLPAAATITRTSGQVNSTLQKTFAGPGSFTYPVGTAGQFSPVTANVTAGAGDLSVRANVGTAPATPPINDATALDRYWTLAETGDLTADLLFTYLQADVDGNENGYRVIRVNTLDQAVGFPNVAPCPGVGSPCVDAGANTIRFNGVQVFAAFWTAGEAAPTAANAQMTGRVLTSDGRGLGGSMVAIADGAGNVRYAMTNPFGYYRFNEVRAGESYVVSVRDKRFTFASRVVNVNDNVAEVNFVPEE